MGTNLRTRELQKWEKIIGPREPHGINFPILELIALKLSTILSSILAKEASTKLSRTRASRTAAL